MTKRAGKIHIRIGRLRIFNCCLKILNGMVKTRQCHTPIGSTQGEYTKKNTQISTMEILARYWEKKNPLKKCNQTLVELNKQIKH